MAIPEQSAINTYTANGATFVFPYTFKINQDTDLSVSVNDVVVTSGYTITGAGSETGGDVTFLVAPADGTTVAVYRDLPYNREADYQTNGDLLAGTLNNDLDRVVMQIQQLAASLGSNGRGVLAPTGYAGGTFDRTEFVSRANKLMGYNASGVLSLLATTSSTTAVQTYLLASEYASLNAVVSAAGGSTVTLLLDGNIITSGNLTVPANIQILASAGVIDNAYDLTIDGPVMAGQQAIFSGAGNVYFPRNATVSPDWWGTGGAALSAAVSSGAGRVEISSDYTLTAPITLPAQDLELIGVGYPTLSSTTTAVFTQTNHGYMNRFQGLKFEGATSGIFYSQTPSTSAYNEYLITDCSFAMNAGVWGVKLVGAQLGRIENCYFGGAGNGIYSNEATLRFIFQCIFKGNSSTANQAAIYDDGQSSAFSTGSYIRDCEIMGYNGVAVKIVECDDAEISGSTIDYNDTNIQILGNDGVKFVGGYIGSRTVNPALYIGKSGAIPTTKVSIVGVHFTGHYENTLYDTLQLVDTDYTFVHGCSFAFYTRYGIKVDGNDLRVNIFGNNFNARYGFGVSPIYLNTALDSAIVVYHNQFANTATIAGMNITNAKVNDNTYCVTEARGQAQVLSGNTNVAVAHGLSYTPNKYDVLLSPANDDAATKNPYISAVDATNLTIALTSAAAVGGAYVCWKIRRGA